ncbi:PKD domain-containing protein [Ekhidna sp.]
MNFLVKGICAVVTVGLLVSCNKDDIDANPTGVGVTEITFVSIATDVEDGDGTLITVTTQGIGATSYVIDFGDADSSEDVLTKGVGGSVSYDYPNEGAEVTYTITVTAKADGFADVVKTQDVTVVHVPEGSLSTVPDSPTGTISNVFAIFSDGMEYDGGLLEYRWGEAVSGGDGVGTSVDEENVLRLSRLGSDAGVLSVETIDPASAFGDGIAATDIHFDVYSDFAEGVDLLKVTLVNSGASETYEVDGLALTDGGWTSFDLDLATGFSSSVSAIDSILFELGTDGTANEHASIYLDNIYLYKETGSSILNGDFEIEGTFATSQWRFATYTDGNTNPFGSSSDGSDFDIDGNDVGDKTRGAKWTSGQVGGPIHTADSRYAYQALALTPNTDYVLQYQYAIDDDNDDPVGLDRHMAGFVLDGHFIDGADALDDTGNDLGRNLGFDAEGKFSDTPNDYGTFVQIPFTSTESGEVSVMFYSVAPDDAWIDNVKVIEAASVTAPTPELTSEATPGNFLEYTFTNTSINGASFVWDFGDGNTSTEKSPTHTYATTGMYNVVLTATNASGSVMTNEMITVSDPEGATFAAVLQNADMQSYPTAENNNNDLVDAWTIDPDDTFNDGSDTPFDFWRNNDLEGWVSDRANNGSTAPDPSDQFDRNGTDKGSSSGTDAMSAGGSSDRSLKFDGTGERAYQPFQVEEGVEYTISANVKSETTPVTDVEGTFYILHSEPADETDLASFAITTVPVIATAINTWQNVEFSFTVNSTFSFPQDRVDENASDILTSTDQEFVIFYFVPTNTVTTDNEVFITDVVIETDGF